MSLNYLSKRCHFSGDNWLSILLEVPLIKEVKIPHFEKAFTWVKLQDKFTINI